MLNIFPNWAKIAPFLTRELLASIRAKCLAGTPLNEEERAYLASAIDRILHDLPVDRAMYLTAQAVKPNTTFSAQSIEIYNRVVELLKDGSSQSAAFSTVASEPIAAKEGTDENLSPAAVKSRFIAIQKRTKPKEN